MFSRSKSNRKTRASEGAGRDRAGLLGPLKSDSALTEETFSQCSVTDVAESTCFVKIEDEDLAAMAQDTKTSIDWHRVVDSIREQPASWQRHSPTDGGIVVSSRTEFRHHHILAAGVVAGCVAEITSVLQPVSSQQHEQQMQAIYGNQFKEGTVVHTVHDLDATVPENVREFRGLSLQELSVKTITFNKLSWFSDYEEWCYLDAVYRTKSSSAVEKVIKTLCPEHIAVGLSDKRTKYFHDVVCGYLLRPITGASNQADGDATSAANGDAATRVMFYANFRSSKLGGSLLSASMDASDETIKLRLLKLAQGTGRLSALVRRQRLGLQSLVDKNRFLPQTNTPCKLCTRTLLVAKLCRVCGHGVCSHCSDKHERVMKPKGNGKLQVAKIRVCTSCLHRIDSARYENITAASVNAPVLLPDPNNSPPVFTKLKNLLADALVNAGSPTKKASVVRVIHTVLGKDDFPASAPAILEADDTIIHALDHLNMEPLSSHEVEIRAIDARSYAIDTSGDPTTNSIPHPVPENEVQRVRAVKRISVSDLLELVELSILCDVAAQEMGCAMSTISIVNDDSLQVVASNVDELRNLSVPRNESMCSHTIMGKSANIVLHPEADIRFSKFASVDQFNVRYYCGFPIVDSQDQVIGAMCCVNSESVRITESQFAMFKKLAATASKIVSGLHGKRDEP